MVYLDYSATTKINEDVLDSYITVSKEFFGNPNSLHKLGVKSKELLNEATKQIANLLKINESEIIYTSSATQANNLAVIGSCLSNENLGNHIIISRLEHPSMYNIVNFLEKKGYEIDYVNNTDEGFIDFDHLKSLIKKTTVLVTICAINSEVGCRQPLKTIRQVIKKENPKTIFHSDITQGIGKININLSDVDLASCSAHKFYGPLGIGLLYKSNDIKINPSVIGSDEAQIISQTPATPLIVAMSKALRISLHELAKKEEIVEKLNEKICNHLLKYENIKINKVKSSIPHILNISLPGIRPETFIHALEEEEIFVSSNTACSKGKPSPTVFLLTQSKELALSSIRISLSYLTTNDEINNFLFHFDKIYNQLTSLEE
jgi:cysteine desulfurase